MISKLSSLTFQKLTHTPHIHNMSTLTTTTTTTGQKVVVIMGPTGCGKTRLSVDLASRFFPSSSEIINSDKIQMYRGLDVTTNKIPPPDRHNVRHHLLGELDPHRPEFTPSDFRSSASKIINQITSRRKLPLVAGGSNSFLYALLARRFDPETDVFTEPNAGFCKELRYECCFICVDVSPPVLSRYLARRVDDMLGSGMLDELSEYFKSMWPGRLDGRGLNKSIGVPEFEGYFNGTKSYGCAVEEIKENTRRLAERQAGKIARLREGAGWEVRRVDATAAVEAAMAGDGAAAEDVWEREVVGPSVKIVKRFLMEG